MGTGSRQERQKETADVAVSLFQTNTGTGGARKSPLNASSVQQAFLTVVEQFFEHQRVDVDLQAPEHH
jgi:hypothetical protein